MRVVLQRVTSARVSVDGQTVGAIGAGVLLLAGIAHDDGEPRVRQVARKCAGLRLFPGPGGTLDRSLVETSREALVVSQFTLLADVRKGRRPSFDAAAPPEVAEPLVEAFCDELRSLGVLVATGRFGAMMRVELVNDGPVTLVIDSADLERPRRG